jgi:dephospho-CoA kinase
MKLPRIGLTGGIGSGKTRVADLFAGHGAALVDTDVIAHEVTAPGGTAIEPLVAAFGAECLTREGAMDRDRMRTLVFSNDAARRTLEGIVHPLIRAACMARAEHFEQMAVHPYIIFVIPLLVEGERWRHTLDRIVVVDCPVETQIARVMHRNGFTRAQVEAIIARQATREARLAVADDVIDNSGTPDLLAPQVARLHATYVGSRA